MQLNLMLRRFHESIEIKTQYDYFELERSEKARILNLIKLLLRLILKDALVKIVQAFLIIFWTNKNTFLKTRKTKIVILIII